MRNCFLAGLVSHFFPCSTIQIFIFTFRYNKIDSCMWLPFFSNITALVACIEYNTLFFIEEIVVTYNLLSEKIIEFGYKLLDYSFTTTTPAINHCHYWYKQIISCKQNLLSESNLSDILLYVVIIWKQRKKAFHNRFRSNCHAVQINFRISLPFAVPRGFHWIETFLNYWPVSIFHSEDSLNTRKQYEVSYRKL